MGIEEHVTDNRILIVDDEESNVDPLMWYLKNHHIPVDLASTVEDAAVLIRDAHVAGHPYRAVISDNHFQDTDSNEYGTSFDGTDLMVILTGKEGHMDEGHHAFARDHFAPSYAAIVAHYSGKVIMFSGSALSDYERDHSMFTDVAVCPKYADEKGGICEEDVIRALEELGFSFRIPISKLRAHKRKEGLETGVREEQRSADHYTASERSHENDVTAFLRSRGLSDEEIRAMGGYVPRKKAAPYSRAEIPMGLEYDSARAVRAAAGRN